MRCRGGYGCSQKPKTGSMRRAIGWLMRDAQNEPTAAYWILAILAVFAFWAALIVGGVMLGAWLWGM